MPILQLEKGDCIEIPLNEATKQCCIGRENCEITIPSDSLSRKHAQITLSQDGNYCLCDLGSTNGSFINGAPLKPKTHYKLQEGDEIIFGNVKAIFTDKDELVNSYLNTNQSTVLANDYSLKSQSTNAQVDPRNASSNSRNEVKTRITSELKYAGFWWRFLASLIDGIILWPFNWITDSIMKNIQHSAQTQLSAATSSDITNNIIHSSMIDIFSVAVIQLVIYWLYFAIMESSHFQGTVGKIVLGMKVVDLQGNKISFLKATGRSFGKYLSSIILLIGYIMAAFTEKKQALHDMIAGCLVVKR
ncbi:MAG: RDD family protein [Candidatus Melainabacteria bacterium]|jgi:uncharacterized RDD family membrane protein YckC